jgi:hypothetical protein
MTKKYNSEVYFVVDVWFLPIQVVNKENKQNQKQTKQ